MKNAKNSAFFAQKAGGMADVFGGAEAAESTRDNGGSISEKGLAAAFKRAKTSGNFAVQNAGLKEVPADLCTFDAYKVPDENWWDSHELVKVDLSNNELASIPVTLATQVTIQHLQISKNSLTSLPDEIFTLKLKFLDITCNSITKLPENVGSCTTLVDLRAYTNKITELPESFGSLENLQQIDFRENCLTGLPATFEKLQKVRKINLDDNQLKSIPESISKLVNLVDISMAKNKITSVEGDAFGPLVNLTILDLHQNQLTDLSSIPNSPKLDQILLAFNQLTTLSNLERCPNLGVLDLHNNKMENLPDSVMTLYQMKTLKVSNNNLANINARLGLLDNLVRLSIEGNPLKRLKPAMRTAGAKDLKEFLKLQLGDQTIAAEEQKQAVALKVPGATQARETDEWDVLLREFVVKDSQLDLRGKNLTYVSPKLWEKYEKTLTFLDLSDNAELGKVGIPEEIANLKALRKLRLVNCGLTSIPKSILQMTTLESLELEKNKLTSFFDDEEHNQLTVKLESLTYINLNGNQLSEIPKLLMFVPNLAQLHMHMNKVSSLNILCRDRFNSLEVLDLGGNKITEVPVAFVKMLQNLTQLVLINNDCQKLPNMLGLHKKLKNVSVEGNPLKSIRRPIIAKGSAGILAYLGDRYIEENDGKAEEWAIEQNKADKIQEKEVWAGVAVEEAKAKEDALRKKYEQDQEDAANYCVVGGVSKPAKAEAAAAETAEAPKEEAPAQTEAAEVKEDVAMEEEKKEEVVAVPEAVVAEAAPEVPAAEVPAVEEVKAEAEEAKDTVQELPEAAAEADAGAQQKVHVSASSISFGDDAPDTPVKRPARAATATTVEAAAEQNQAHAEHPSKSSVAFGNDSPDAPKPRGAHPSASSISFGGDEPQQPVRSAAHPSQSSISFGGDAAPAQTGQAKAHPSQSSLSLGAEPAQAQASAATSAHPSQSSISFGADAPTPAPAKEESKEAATADDAAAAEESPAAAKARLTAEIERVTKEVEKAIDDVDNNFALKGPEKRERRKELNKLQSLKNRLTKELAAL